MRPVWESNLGARRLPLWSAGKHHLARALAAPGEGDRVIQADLGGGDRPSGFEACDAGDRDQFADNGQLAVGIEGESQVAEQRIAGCLVARPGLVERSGVRNRVWIDQAEEHPAQVQGELGLAAGLNPDAGLASLVEPKVLFSQLPDHSPWKAWAAW